MSKFTRPQIRAISWVGGLLFIVLSMVVLTGFGNSSQTKLEADYDPLAVAMEKWGRINNYEATVPPQCYTKTNGTANPCWTCHTHPVPPNELIDWELQEEYAFSDAALTNHWDNLFKDRTEAIAGISDEAVRAYIDTDNYTPLMAVMQDKQDFPGYQPDLDLSKGFDKQGFARDGSGWRAFRYKPFLGSFWPTNGNTDDVMIRLPKQFQTLNGQASLEIYKINLAILEAAISAGPLAGLGGNFQYEVEPINETLAKRDLNGDGEIGGTIREIKGFPTHFAGDAEKVEVVRYVYPKDVEFLHSVRYVDPDRPGLTAMRMKELRYSKKVQFLDEWAMTNRYEHEFNEKEAGTLPRFSGSPLVGILGNFGWQLQGWIEDEKGRLRLQTHEEHQFCMGCHNALGITVDQTFSLARKIPGAAGWRYQNLNDIPDVPQQGHEKPEIATYFERVGGGDEFRANAEILERFFPEGQLNETEVARAAPGGDKDITHLIVPSRERAMTLNKAYMLLVREQAFESGRDTVIGPIENVHHEIVNGDTALNETGKIYRDGRLWLDWRRSKK